MNLEEILSLAEQWQPIATMKIQKGTYQAEEQVLTAFQELTATEDANCQKIMLEMFLLCFESGLSKSDQLELLRKVQFLIVDTTKAGDGTI